MNPDSARRYLERHEYPAHVIQGGLEGLLSGWERVARSVAKGEVQYQDDYLNDMDGRHVLEKMLPHLDPAQRSEADKRLAEADGLIRGHLIATRGCLWGEENARKHEYSRDRHWWYYHRPKTVDTTWTD
jgi:hypothetical protein